MSMSTYVQRMIIDQSGFGNVLPIILMKTIPDYHDIKKVAKTDKNTDKLTIFR